jgi:hypothetical protein
MFTLRSYSSDLLPTSLPTPDLPTCEARSTACAARWCASAKIAGISTKAAEELLGRMAAKVAGQCAERDRQAKEQRAKYPGTNKAINGPIERRFR